MKKRFKRLLSIAGVIIVLMVVNSACGTIYNEWPSVDVMRENLKDEDYTIEEDDIILIDDNEYMGNVIIATKKSEFVAGFWTDDEDVAEIVYEYWGSKYQSEHTLRVGTTVYSGTDRAIKHAGIRLR